MLKFTLVKGEIVLSPDIVLFESLGILYKSKDGEKLLRTIYYMHSTDEDNSFSGIDMFFREENVFMAVFKKESLKSLGLSKKLTVLYEEAEELYIKHTTTAEARLDKSIDIKLDQISRMLDETTPVIEESLTKSGEVKYNSNLNIILNMFSKIDVIMKARKTLQAAVAKQSIGGKTRGDVKPSFLEKGLL